MEPEVSVIIPAYNCEKTIKRAINSALNQADVTVEIIVLNDGSSDNTYNIIRDFAMTDERIKLYSNNQNSGVAFTRNLGCSYATGEYIAFLDSDDFWKPDKLYKQLRIMKKRSADLSFTSYFITRKGDNSDSTLYEVPITATYKSLLKENVIGCSTVVIKSSLMRTHMFNANFFHEDYVLWLELMKEGYTAIGIREPLSYYTKGGRSADKFKAAKNRWIVFRKSEKLGVFRSLYVFIAYVLSSVRKYRI